MSERSVKALEAGKRIISSYASWDAANGKWVPGSVPTHFKPAFSNANKNHKLKLAFRSTFLLPLKNRRA